MTLILFIIHPEQHVVVSNMRKAFWVSSIIQQKPIGVLMSADDLILSDVSR